jgi:hypothetical protein
MKHMSLNGRAGLPMVADRSSAGRGRGRHPWRSGACRGGRTRGAGSRGATPAAPIRSSWMNGLELNSENCRPLGLRLPPLFGSSASKHHYSGCAVH